AHRIAPPASELPAAAHRGRDDPGGARDQSRGSAFVPRAGTSDHGAFARIADFERLPIPAFRPVLDQLLSGARASYDDRRDQSRRRPAARRAQSEAQEMTALLEVEG